MHKSKKQKKIPKPVFFFAIEADSGGCGGICSKVVLEEVALKIFLATGLLEVCSRTNGFGAIALVVDCESMMMNRGKHLGSRKKWKSH